MKLTTLKKFACCSLASLGALSAGAEQTAFKSLPENTMLALRVNSTKANIDSFINNSQMGKIFFDDKRLDGIKKTFESLLKKKGKYENFQEALGKFGMSEDEIMQLVYSRFGAAVVLEGQDDQLSIVYLWLKNTPELSGKLFQGMQNVIEDNANEKRVDLEIAGRNTVMVLNQTKGEISLARRQKNQ